MTAAIAVPITVALIVGLVAGFAIARLRRPPTPMAAPRFDPTELTDDDTRPTLVPFRTTREGGRNATRTSPGEVETPEERDQLDALLADLDRRPRR